MLSKQGTLVYMAPEMFTFASYNETVDIWSLGKTNYNFYFYFFYFRNYRLRINVWLGTVLQSVLTGYLRNDFEWKI